MIAWLRDNFPTVRKQFHRFKIARLKLKESHIQLEIAKLKLKLIRIQIDIKNEETR